jgi:putative redox protein
VQAAAGRRPHIGAGDRAEPIAPRGRTIVPWVTAATGETSDTVDIRLGVGLALVARQTNLAGESAPHAAPLDLLLASLGACTAITLRQYAAARDWPLEAVEVDLNIVSWQRSKRVERILSIQGALGQDQREALLAAADQSPVTLLIRPGLLIHTDLA